MINKDDMPASGYMVPDEKAFERFFKEHFEESCALCQFRFGFDADLAKDVVHDAFVKLWEYRHNLANDAALKPCLYKIIANGSLDIIKHEKVKRAYEKFFLEAHSASNNNHAFAEADIKKLTACIEAAIAAMPEQMRHVFELSRYHEMKYRDIALRLDISIKTVEAHMSRALARLRKIVRNT